MYTGANTSVQSVAKLVMNVNGKTHILAACWNAQLHSRKSQPVQKLSTVFSSLFSLGLGDYFSFVCLFINVICKTTSCLSWNTYLHSCMYVLFGAQRERCLPGTCWQTRKQYFLCMLDSSTHTGSSVLSEMQCPLSAQCVRNSCDLVSNPQPDCWVYS